MKKLISFMLSLTLISGAVMAYAEEVTEITENEVNIETAVSDEGLVISADGKVLEESVDYILTYRDNIEVGTGTVIVTFIGNYSGTKEVPFNIKKKSTSSGGGGGGGGSSTGSNVSVKDDEGKTVNVSKKETTDGITLTLPVGRTIDVEHPYTIVVKDTKGKVKPDTEVTLKDRDGNEVKGKTDENGIVILPVTVVPTEAPTTTSEPIMITQYGHNAYISGYEDGNFMPDGNITRAETASMLYRVIETGNTNGESLNFTDLVPGAWYLEPVNAMSAEGIISGYTDNTFRPNNQITRAEFVTMIMQYTGMSEVESVPFADVQEGAWYSDYISAAYGAGYINGYEDGTFRPDSSITRAEAVKIINSVLDRTDFSNEDNPFYDVKDTHWAYKQILEAAVSH